MSDGKTKQAEPRRTAAATRRRRREAEILAATRALFDERGVRDVHIDEIAKTVGTNRAILYRHFSGKEELFALTLVGYLDELRDRMQAVMDAGGTPRDRLVALVEAFVDYGIEYPAFVDCAQALMRRPGPELLDEISESALFRLGRGIAACLAMLSSTLDEGVAEGTFAVEDTSLLANHMYATGFGALQLARVGMLIKELAPGIPTIAPISVVQVRQYLVDTSLALAGCPTR
ncbi:MULTISPECIES: TetR/AcrR family transcriptional regulator [unclassified Nocardioides]|uniref:TetR/AcrR family transcriptional regulator n=1 Tax=unclassified Nocardioides TaxID=2615069 RepID=UPI0006FAE06C|nr:MULTISPECIES: TetR/AcrR family transcriptional regulator [unclassified Nocardioides]KQY64121.1 TetR family transcriptional regulator [Nocardioides sp. Root140]KQZ70041.1 TetR family transcriptional regulator [Nocardioides sp. Root151]KRF16139.1 TetR family transcriptional regulator [Nocardioides sp. Soil796]